MFPEAFISADAKGLDFGARVGLRTAEGRNDVCRYFDSAIPLGQMRAGPVYNEAVLTAEIDLDEIARL